MKVALFTDSDVFAGTERHILDLAVGLRDHGLEPLIACPQPSPLAERAAGQNLHLIPIQKHGMIDWRAIWILVRLLNRKQVDVIHAHNGRTCLTAAIAVTLARRGSFVATQHFLNPRRAGRSGFIALISGWVHQWVERRIDRFIAVSNAVRLHMLARRDAPSKKITVIAHGIPEPDLQLVLSREEARGKIGVAVTTRLILCIARLEQEKDVITLVRAMVDVAASCPSAICLVAGDGNDRARLEQEIAALELNERVVLLGFRSDVTTLLAACDVLVLPSVAEPFGLVLLEAMAHGRAVVSTSAGGPMEIVSDGETGLLVPPQNPCALGAVIVRICEETALREQMACRGRNRFLENYSVARMARDTANCYRAAGFRLLA